MRRPILCGLVLAALASACGGEAPPSEGGAAVVAPVDGAPPSDAEGAPEAVYARPIETARLEARLAASGSIEARRETEAAAEVGGRLCSGSLGRGGGFC